MDIRLLGTVELHDGHTVVRLARSGECCLLATLALNVGRQVSAATLIDHIWTPDKQTDASARNLADYVRNVRAALTRAGGLGEWLHTHRTARTYSLSIPPELIDYHRFRRDVAAAIENCDVDQLQNALDLWRGPALSNVNGQWADNRRHALALERHQAIEKLLALHLRAERYEHVLHLAGALDEDLIVNDDILILAAQAFARSGRYTAINRWLDRTLAWMRTVLAASPAEATVARIRQLAAHPTERSRQALDATVGPERSVERQAPRAIFSMRGDTADFVGRDDEIRTLMDAVVAAIDGPPLGIMMYTVDGMVGVGKTTFSLHAAHRLADRFPDGRIFVELYGHSPTQPPRAPADVLMSLLGASGMDRDDLPKELDDLASLWRHRIAGKKILLVLDDAASHDQIRPLLPGTPECLVLITSRHRLPALDGAHALTLDVLSPDQAADMLLRLAHRSPMAVEPEAVARVAALCGYLPSAIALVAGRLRNHPMWNFAYLADRLAADPDRLEYLTAGDRSIRAAFTMSYEHLRPERQRIFILLGVHPGPTIDAYAVAALADCSLADARRHLEALHGDHLVQETAPGRYQLHDLLRIYAASLAAAADQDDADKALRRVLEYYLGTTMTAGVHMPMYATPITIAVQPSPAHHPTLDTARAARAWLDAELRTLAACLDHATTHPDMIVALAAALHSYLRVSGAWEHGQRIHRAAVAAAEQIGDHLGMANALHNLGRVYYLRNDYDQAGQVLRQAYELFAQLGSPLGQANTRFSLGRLCYLRGDNEAAEMMLGEADELFTELDDRLGQANTLHSLGIVHRMRGSYDRAEQVQGLAHRLFTELGDQLGQANTLHSLSIVYRLRGGYWRAEQVLGQALRLFTGLGNRLGEADVLHNLGIVYRLQGGYGRAEQVLEQAHRLYTTMGNQRGQASTIHNLGRVCCLRGEYEQAEDRLRQAGRLCTKLGDEIGQANTLRNLGVVQYLRGDYDMAERLLGQARQAFVHAGYRLGQGNTLLSLGRVYYLRENFARAAEFLTAAHELFVDAEDFDGQAEALNCIGDVALADPAAGPAEPRFTEAHAIANTIGSARHKALALVGLGHCAERAGDRDAAAGSYRNALVILRRLGSPETASVVGCLARLEDAPAQR